MREALCLDLLGRCPGPSCAGDDGENETAGAQEDVRALLDKELWLLQRPAFLPPATLGKVTQDHKHRGIPGVDTGLLSLSYVDDAGWGSTTSAFTTAVPTSVSPMAFAAAQERSRSESEL